MSRPDDPSPRDGVITPDPSEGTSASDATDSGEGIPPTPPDLFSELRRRKVYKVGAGYLAVVFAGLQSADVIFPALGLGQGALNAAVIIGLLGFPLAIGLAWVFDVKDGGIERTASLPPGVPEGQLDRWVRLKAAAVGAGFVVVVLAGVRIWQPAPGGSDSVVPSDLPTVAVLPLDDFSPDGSYAYLADGLHEEILHQLARVSGLQVTSRTSSRMVRGLPARAAADSLGVRYVVEGSVRFAADTLLLTIQLIDALDDVHVWSDALTRRFELNALLEVQRTLAGQILVAIRGTLASSTGLEGDPPTTSLEAYNEFLRGLHAEARFDLPSMWAALEHYRTAVRLDPEFGRAHAKLTQMLAVLNNFGGVEQGAHFPEMREHAALALEYAPDDPDALLAQQALIWPITRDWPEALRLYQTVLERYPDNVPALWGLAEWYGVIAGDVERSLELLRRAEALDPLSPTIWTVRGWVLYNNRDFDGCIAELERVLAVNPMSWTAALHVAVCNGRLGRSDAALAALEQAADVVGDAPSPRLAAAASEIGETDMAREIVSRARALKASGGSVSAAELAMAYSALGEVETSLEWLERSFRDEAGVYFLRSPEWDSVAGHERFQALWDQAGLMGTHPSLRATE